MRRLTQVRRRRANPLGLVTLAVLALALPLMARVASAQTGTIVGTITDQQTKTPVPSVQVQIIGTTRGVISGPDGHYRIVGAPSGPTQLRVTRIGYAAATQTVTVPTGDVATVDFVLVATNVTLDQVIVTGTQTTERERENGNNVAVIQTDSVNKAAVETFSDLIAGKAAGVNVAQSSGEVGSASRIRIRGNNSISLSNDPLLVIDGIYVDNGSNSLATAIFTGGQTVSRFDDLNPDEIENVEILKGPSASALYGTAGANGVILVTTKKGTAGHAVWTAHADYGGVYNGAVYPANFGQVGALTPAGGGPGETTNCTLITQGTGGCVANKDSLLQWNPLMSHLYTPFTTGNARYAFGGSVAGGGDNTKYFASGDFNNDHGIQQNSFQSKNNGRANLQATPNSKVDFSINAGYLQSRLDLPQNDNNEASAIANGELGQPVNDARHGYFVLIDPAQSNSIVTSQDVERFTGGATGNWRPLGWLTFTGVTGLDITNRNDFQLIPIGAEAAFSALNASGFATSNPFQTQVVTAQFNAAAQYDVTSSIHGTSTVGTQYTNTTLRGTGASGFGLISGTGSVAGTTKQFAASQTGNNEVVDIGYYAQQQFGWRDKLFLTGAVRIDDNSSFGQVYVPSWYPSVSASWVVGEEPWFPKGVVMSSLRLRSAFGFSGQHPGFQQAETFYNTITAITPQGETPAVTLGSIGNNNLKPERSGEFEGGFDAGFWRDRLNLQVTGYSKATTDALVAVNLAPSVGGVNFGSGSSVAETSTRFENLGQVDNRGLEISLTANLIQTRNTRLDFTVNEAYNKNKVISLGPNIAPIFFNSGLESNLQAIKAGLPLGAWYNAGYTYSDANKDGIIEPGEVTVAGSPSFQGNRDPAQQLSLNPQLTIFKYFKISTLFDHVSDVVDLDFSASFRCVDFENCQWDYDPHTTLQNQARVAAALAGTDAGFLEDGSFWKWRELSVRASAPEFLTRRLRVSALSFTIAGRNLRTWTKYTGVDPEINSASSGSNALFQEEFFTQGITRYWTGRFDLTF